MKVKLKLCPFCGKRADLYTERITKKYARYIVQCRGFELTTGRHWREKESAIIAWNKRISK